MNNLIEKLQSGTSIKLTIGILGSIIANALGGWDYALQTLVVFMIVDYVSGVAVAIFFRKSEKSQTGGFNSNTGFVGLLKKMFILLAVWMANQVDLMAGDQSLVRLAVIIMYLANELGSITENYGLMGLPMPDAIKKAIDVLNKK